VVARRTGISQLLLRAWERRYGAVEPRRTPTGRRFYSDADLKKLHLLRQLTDAGHRIGDVANLPVARLEELAAEIAPAPIPALRSTRPVAAPDQLLGEALQAVTELDGPGLESVLQRAAVVLSRPVLRRQMIEPLLVAIGERWRDGSLRIAHEHLATSIVRTFLGSLRSGGAAAAGAPAMVAAAPSGHMHELGALMAAGHAEEMGWNVHYLGADVPAGEIAAAALQAEARLVVLSLIYPGHDPGTRDQLRTLRRALGPEVAIIVGGGAAPTYADVLAEIDAVLVSDAGVLDRQLRSLS
jgi:DNA-binding transcriptional MerR regulator/methylmalonyl-CoA mutase cobalamin-binding subunit